MQYQWDIIGHQSQLAQLEQEIASGNLSHAYLFSGPKQTGKYRVAKIFAKILQCPNHLCRNCTDCKAIVAGTHPDTVLLQDDGQSLGIDTIRNLIGQANLTAQSPYRIFLIENIERMPIEAQNSFLKTLEEPPGKTVFILTSSRINDVLPTILSRVRHYYFFNIGYETLKSSLKKEFSGRSDTDEIINMAQGRPGLAISLLKDPEVFNRQREMYSTIETFLKKDNLAGKFLFVEQLLADATKDEDPLDFFFDAFTRYLRKLLFEYVEQESHPLQSRFALTDLVELFESLEKTRYLIERNANKRLALENLLIATEKNQK